MSGGWMQKKPKPLLLQPPKKVLLAYSPASSPAPHTHTHEMHD
jgi:hypothetical protein